MDRRDFFKAAGIPAAAVVAARTTLADNGEPSTSGKIAATGAGSAGSAKDRKKTWLMFDWWHIEHQDNVALEQGEAQWLADATYEDPTLDYLGMWPRVWLDEASGTWRMLYCASGFPLTLMGAESDDGLHWRPMNRPDVDPGGTKLAANHLFTIERANGGPVYIDPVAADGYRFKLYCIQRGGPAAKRAALDQNSYFHEIVKGEGAKPYIADALVAVSKDGLNWKLDEQSRWGQPPWHPDPPINCFYDHRNARHVMVTRPGWGDRRVAIQISDDARRWRDLQVILQPDPLDPPQMQMYGMPVVPYEGAFVGLLWAAHFSSAQRLDRFNQLWGPIDCQLAYSNDGVNFHRGLRRPLVRLGEPGQPHAGVVYPTQVVDAGDQLRIYSVGTPDLHHQYAKTQFLPKGKVPASSIVIHTLRKDGFMYLESRGNWGRFITKAITLLEPELRLNANAPYGEIRFQLTDLNSRPLPGYTFDDCVAVKEQDQLDAPVAWKDKDLTDRIGKVTRLEVMFRNARLYALRGNFHFCDALDVALLKDGKQIDPDFMDD